MNKMILCAECDLEFKVKHEASDELYKVLFCPFCGLELADDEEEYDCEEDEE